MTPEQHARLGQLWDFISQMDPALLDFNEFGRDCDTPACALGWATKLWPDLIELHPVRIHTGGSPLDVVRVRLKGSTARVQDDILEAIQVMFGGDPTVVHLFTWANWTKESWLASCEDVLVAHDPEFS